MISDHRAKQSGVISVHLGQNRPHGKRPCFQIGRLNHRLILGDEHTVMGAIPLHHLTKKFCNIPNRDKRCSSFSKRRNIHLERDAVSGSFGLTQGHDDFIPTPHKVDLIGFLDPFHLCAKRLRNRSDGDQCPTVLGPPRQMSRSSGFISARDNLFTIQINIDLRPLRRKCLGQSFIFRRVNRLQCTIGQKLIQGVQAVYPHRLFDRICKRT